MLPCHLKCKSSCLTAEAGTTLNMNEFNYFNLVFHKDNLNIKHKYICNIWYIHISYQISLGLIDYKLLNKCYLNLST